MAGKDTLQDSARIFKVIRQRAYAATLVTIEKAAQDTLMRLDSYRKYYNITGNTWTSTTIGIYYKGKLVSIFNKGAEDEQPTRPTLRKGEAYNLPNYYKGGYIGGEKPYVGTVGNGKQWGPTLGPWSIRRMHSPKYKTWNMIVIIPVSYANYNQKIIATMQAIMDNLPSVIDYDIVRVDGGVSQTDMYKDLPF